MAQVLAIPQPARFGSSYVAIWGGAELGKSPVAGTFGTLLSIFYLDYLGMIGLISGLAMILAAVLLTWYSFRGRTL